MRTSHGAQAAWKHGATRWEASVNWSRNLGSCGWREAATHTRAAAMFLSIRMDRLSLHFAGELEQLYVPSKKLFSEEFN